MKKGHVSDTPIFLLWFRDSTDSAPVGAGSGEETESQAKVASPTSGGGPDHKVSHQDGIVEVANDEDDGNPTTTTSNGNSNATGKDLVASDASKKEELSAQHAQPSQAQNHSQGGNNTGAGAGANIKSRATFDSSRINVSYRHFNPAEISFTKRVNVRSVPTGIHAES